MKHLITLLALTAFLFVGTDISASNVPVNSEDNAAGTIMMDEAYSSAAMTKAEVRAAKKADKRALKAEKRAIKMEKRMAKLNKMIAKKMNKHQLGGFDDPIDKWVWFAIIAAAAAIIFGIIGGVFGWTLGALLWVAAIVFLVVWLIKKFA